jgi:hypothetical protein
VSHALPAVEDALELADRGVRVAQGGLLHEQGREAAARAVVGQVGKQRLRRPHRARA